MAKSTPDRLSIRSLAFEDIRAVVAIHMEAFPESALAMLGSEATRRYYRQILSGSYHVTALGAFLSDRLVGFCFAGVFPGLMNDFLRINQKYLAYRVLSHPWLVINPIFRERLALGVRTLKRLIKHAATAPRPRRPIERSFRILAIAVRPGYQGSGAGKQLMIEAESYARLRGFFEMGLTVHLENRKAVGFYERLGWEKVLDDKVWKGGMRKLMV